MTLVRLSQPRNALFPIEVTPSGIVTLVRLLQCKNAPNPIEVTGNPLYVLGMTKDPLAVVKQSVTLYSVLSPFSAKVRVFV